MIDIMTDIHIFMSDHKEIIKISLIMIGAVAAGFVINMDKRLKKDRL